MEDKSHVKLGDGLADSLKNETNNQLQITGNIIINKIFEFIRKKVQELDIEKLLSKKDKDELVSLLATELAEKGLVPKGYAGLPDNYLIDNLHQDGYISGLYVGYVLAIMSLVDHDAPKDLVISVRDDIRPNLLGHHYNDRKDFHLNYQDEKYSWVEKTDKDY